MAIMHYELCIVHCEFRMAQRGLTEAIESCNSPLVFRRKIGGVPRRGEVVRIMRSAECGIESFDRMTE